MNSPAQKHADNQWLISMLRKNGINVENVLLANYDFKKVLHIDWKNDDSYDLNVFQ